MCLVANQPYCFYADSAASNHMTDKREFLTTFKEIPLSTWKVPGIGVLEMHAAGKGKIDVIPMVNGEEIRGTFHNVLCSQPKSQTFLLRNSYRIWRGNKLQGNKVFFCKDDITIMVGERVGDSIYSLRGTLVN